MIKRIFSAGLFILSLCSSLFLLEGLLRFKNRDMKNYDIEMWRYANEIKRVSRNPILDHEHRENVESTLQSVLVRTNKWGLRGGPVDSNRRRRILFLGSSITFGWGVKEDETIEGRVEKALRERGEDVEVWNAGVGNYNATRYVELFMTHLKDLQPTDIVVHFFLRDGEDLERGRSNWWLRNSECAVTLWNLYQRFHRKSGESSLVEHYAKVYDKSAPDYQHTKLALSELAHYATQHKVRLYFAMVPDVHNLEHYPFAAIHDEMKELATSLGYRYVDLLPGLQGLKPTDVWAMAGDPHPNSLGHMKMAESLLPTLALR